VPCREPVKFVDVALQASTARVVKSKMEVHQLITWMWAHALRRWTVLIFYGTGRAPGGGSCLSILNDCATTKLRLELSIIAFKFKF
jgi:hypothetical protein